MVYKIIIRKPSVGSTLQTNRQIQVPIFNGVISELLSKIKHFGKRGLIRAESYFLSVSTGQEGRGSGRYFIQQGRTRGGDSHGEGPAEALAVGSGIPVQKESS